MVLYVAGIVCCHRDQWISPSQVICSQRFAAEPTPPKISRTWSAFYWMTCYGGTSLRLLIKLDFQWYPWSCLMLCFVYVVFVDEIEYFIELTVLDCTSLHNERVLLLKRLFTALCKTRLKGHQQLLRAFLVIMEWFDSHHSKGGCPKEVVFP